MKELIDSTRKIIGYKAPFDMYQGAVKVGSIFIASENYPGKYEIPYAQRLSLGLGQYYFPAEWVENYWEPVYEEEPVYELVQGIPCCDCDLPIGNKGRKLTLKKWLELFPFLTEADIKAKPEWFKLVEKQ